MHDALVFAGGDAIPRAVGDHLDHDRLVIAADSGLDHAHALGFHADLLVGDLDSVDADLLRAARDNGTKVEHHPVEKDATDLELALEAARSRGAIRVTVVGGTGGRLDHLLANALLLAAPRFGDLELDALLPPARVTVVRNERTLPGRVGALCTLLPAGGPADGVTTTGLRYPLRDERLAAGTTRGVSNVFVDVTATVVVRAGVLLAIQPDALEA